jgi:hypothetical protein
LATKKTKAVSIAMSSAKVTEIQIPSKPQIMGRNKTAATWKTKVRKKDINAEVNPSLSAVKKEEKKMA